MSSARKLFLVVLGGRCKGCHVEQHDVRWVVGETIDATLPALRREWIGLRRGLHIDSYRCINHADGHRIEVADQDQDSSSAGGPQLWFVNLGAYDPMLMAEQHAFGVIVARSSASAKARARQRWLLGHQQVHKDDLHPVAMDSALDDLLPIHGNGQWYLKLTADPQVGDAPTRPDWYGYWTI